MHPRAFFFPGLNTLIFSLFNVFSKTPEDETQLRISLIAFQGPLPDSSVTDFLWSWHRNIETFCTRFAHDRLLYGYPRSFFLLQLFSLLDSAVMFQIRLRCRGS